ncbi:MAG: sensor histidine kinase, partial [Actinomycetota bacterium]
LKPAENRLLEALAGHVGLAMQSVRLAEQLRARLTDVERAAGELTASRSRLMLAADAERVRLEKLIHEGVERELVAMSEQLTGAERTFARSRARAVTVLERVAEQANHTQETLRDLARGIFPPLLSDRGVMPAIESQVRKLPGSITVIGTIEDRFDPRAEAAVYFCCIEALRRAAHPDDGSRVTVELGRENGWVRFAVRGHAPALTADLQLLIDRVEAVGGSLEVRGSDGEGELAGRVPVQVAAAQTPASRSGSNADLGT